MYAEFVWSKDEKLWRFWVYENGDVCSIGIVKNEDVVGEIEDFTKRGYSVRVFR